MPRKLRIEYGGAFYHVMNREDHREDIFRDTADRESFLSALESFRWNRYGEYLKTPRQRPKWRRGSRPGKRRAALGSEGKVIPS